MVQQKEAQGPARQLAGLAWGWVEDVLETAAAEKAQGLGAATTGKIGAGLGGGRGTGLGGGRTNGITGAGLGEGSIGDGGINTGAGMGGGVTGRGGGRVGVGDGAAKHAEALNICRPHKFCALIFSIACQACQAC